jgi:hypothetical protein
MSENKNYKLIKTTPNDVILVLRPISNPLLTRKVVLTDRQPFQILPQDWALGVFMDNGCYALYKNKAITFDDNDSIVKAAYETGVYFDEQLDFTPAKPNRSDQILRVLESGNREAILRTIREEGKEVVKDVATANVKNLKQGVVNMLESTLGVQLTVDGVDE